MMNRLMLILPLFAILSACKDEPEQIPAYLNLKTFQVTASGGESWQKITDGWLYVNGEFLGAYTLPAIVPVLAEGDAEIILFPGVKENGIEATPNIYPYLKRFTQHYTLVAGQTTSVQPTTDYDSANKYGFGIGRGDFDGGSTIGLENRDADGVINVEISADGALAGKCMIMRADTAHPIMDIATELMEDLPFLGSPEVWLELQYHTDVPFFLYLLNGDPENTQKVFQFNKTESWNKIYINLTQHIVDSGFPDQRLYFRLSLPRNENGQYAQTEGTVRLDNIRVVHF
ncbi:MAG: hypothetical protein JNN28_05185 [Saprospiraceae bacterium]|nr:hypothetical protein [Saprospiraceae bacterium]